MKNIKRIIRKTGVAIAGIMGFSMFYLIMYNVLHYDKFFPWPTVRNNVLDYVYNFLPISVLAVSNYFVIFKLWRNTVVEKKPPLKFLADIVLGFTILMAVNLLYIVISSALGLNSRVGWPGTILCNTLIILGLEIMYYFKNFKETLRKSEYTKREAIQYQYDLLRTQVNPHFLFNSLNIQLSLIMSDKQKAYDFTVALAQIYRYILTTQNRTKVPLSDEMEFLRHYIYTLEIRYGHNLRVTVCGDDKNISANRYVIPHTMQLLMENVTKHNIISSSSPMNVRIDIGEECIIMSNPICAAGSKTESGIGHKYIAGQYRNYGKVFRVENDGHTFTAYIPYL